RRHLRRAFSLGFAITMVLVMIELAFGGPIFALLSGAPASGDALWQLNRGVSALAVLVWPLVALAWQRWARWLGWALPPVLLGLTLLSPSSASVLALVAGLLAALLAESGRSMARAVMVVAVVATLFGSPFAAGLARQAGLTTADWLSYS